MGACLFHLSMGWVPRRGIVSESVDRPTATGSDEDQRRAITQWTTEKLTEQQDEHFRENDRPVFDPSDTILLSLFLMAYTWRC